MLSDILSNSKKSKTSFNAPTQQSSNITGVKLEFLDVPPSQKIKKPLYGVARSLINIDAPQTEPEMGDHFQDKRSSYLRADTLKQAPQNNLASIKLPNYRQSELKGHYVPDRLQSQKMPSGKAIHSLNQLESSTLINFSELVPKKDNNIFYTEQTDPMLMPTTKPVHVMEQIPNHRELDEIFDEKDFDDQARSPIYIGSGQEIQDPSNKQQNPFRNIFEENYRIKPKGIGPNSKLFGIKIKTMNPKLRAVRLSHNQGSVEKIRTFTEINEVESPSHGKTNQPLFRITTVKSLNTLDSPEKLRVTLVPPNLVPRQRKERSLNDRSSVIFPEIKQSTSFIKNNISQNVIEPRSPSHLSNLLNPTSPKSNTLSRPSFYKQGPYLPAFGGSRESSVERQNNCSTSKDRSPGGRGRKLKASGSMIDLDQFNKNEKNSLNNPKMFIKTKTNRDRENEERRSVQDLAVNIIGVPVPKMNSSMEETPKRAGLTPKRGKIIEKINRSPVNFSDAIKTDESFLEIAKSSQSKAKMQVALVDINKHIRSENLEDLPDENSFLKDGEQLDIHVSGLYANQANQAESKTINQDKNLPRSQELFGSSSSKNSIDKELDEIHLNAAQDLDSIPEIETSRFFTTPPKDPKKERTAKNLKKVVDMMAFVALINHVIKKNIKKRSEHIKTKQMDRVLKLGTEFIWRSCKKELIALYKEANFLQITDKYSEDPKERDEIEKDIKLKGTIIFKHLRNIIEALTNAVNSKMLPVDIMRCLAIISGNHGVPPNGYFFLFELCRLDFTVYGTYKSMNSEQTKMILVFLFLFRILLVRFLIEPWKQIPELREDELIRKNLRSCASVFYIILTDMFKNKILKRERTYDSKMPVFSEFSASVYAFPNETEPRKLSRLNPTDDIIYGLISKENLKSFYEHRTAECHMIERLINNFYNQVFFQIEFYYKIEKLTWQKKFKAEK